MDKTLERILSLIPKKPNGEYIHGAKKQFCTAIGAPHSAVTQWENGETKSYMNYLGKIASVYHVTVEWLMGNDDADTLREELFEEERILLNAYRKFSSMDKNVIMKLVESLEEKYE